MVFYFKAIFLLFSTTERRKLLMRYLCFYKVFKAGSGLAWRRAAWSRSAKRNADPQPWKQQSAYFLNCSIVFGTLSHKINCIMGASASIGTQTFRNPFFEPAEPRVQMLFLIFVVLEAQGPHKRNLYLRRFWMDWNRETNFMYRSATLCTLQIHLDC